MPMNDEEKAIFIAKVIKQRAEKVLYNKKYRAADVEGSRLRNKEHQALYRERLKAKLAEVDVPHVPHVVGVNVGAPKKPKVPKPPKDDTPKLPELMPVINQKTSYTLKDEVGKHVDIVVIPKHIKDNTGIVENKKNIDKLIKYFHLVDCYFDDTPVDTGILYDVYAGRFEDEKYIYIVDRLKYLNDDNIDNFVDVICKKIININTLRTKLDAFVVLTSYFDVFKKSYFILSNLQRRCINIYKHKRDDNANTEEEQNKMIDFDPIEIEKCFHIIDSIEDALLIALYCLEVPRRIDYNACKISYTSNIDDLNEGNHLIIKDEKCTFVFNDYKTYDTYAKQLLVCCDRVNWFINRYIFLKVLKEGDYLWYSRQISKDKPLTKGMLSNKIKTVFLKVFNKPATNTYIRMSYATYINKLNLSNNDIKKVCEKMGHNLTIHNQYIKKFVI